MGKNILGHTRLSARDFYNLRTQKQAERRASLAREAVREFKDGAGPHAPTFRIHTAQFCRVCGREMRPTLAQNGNRALVCPAPYHVCIRGAR